MMTLLFDKAILFIKDDNLFKNMLDKKSTTAEERKPYADKIRAELEA